MKNQQYRILQPAQSTAIDGANGRATGMHFSSGLIRLMLMLLLFTMSSLLCARTVSQGKMGSLHVYRWTTSQGMQVLFAPARELPMLDIRLVFDAGAARTPMPLAGTAQLTNQLILEGSAQISANQLAEQFEEYGVQYGNGSYRDMAVIDFRTLSDPQILEGVMQTMSKMFSRPLFSQEDLTREINVLKVGLKLEQENPSSMAALKFYETLYQNHAYATPIKGTLDSLARITPQHIRDFYEQYYVARNGILTLTGDINLEQATQMAEQLSGFFPQGQPAAPLEMPTVISGGNTVQVHFNATQSAILMGKVSIKRGDPDYYPLYVANHILGGSGFSSRLVKDLRVKHGLTYSVYSSFQLMREKGPFMIGMTTKNESAAQAVALLKDNLKTFIEKGVSAEELEQAKMNIRGNMPLQTASNKDISQHLAVIGFYDLALDYHQQFLEQVKQVTLEQVQQVFSRYISLESLTTVIAGPAATAD